MPELCVFKKIMASSGLSWFVFTLFVVFVNAIKDFMLLLAWHFTLMIHLQTHAFMIGHNIAERISNFYSCIHWAVQYIATNQANQKSKALFYGTVRFIREEMHCYIAQSNSDPLFLYDLKCDWNCSRFPSQETANVDMWKFLNIVKQRKSLYICKTG